MHSQEMAKLNINLHTKNVYFDSCFTVIVTGNLVYKNPKCSASESRCDITNKQIVVIVTRNLVVYKKQE